MSFFIFLFSVSTGQRRVPHTHAGHSAAPVPHASWHADRSPVLATHALRAAAPTTTWRYSHNYLDEFFFSFLPFFLFNSNRCRTMVATTSPPSPYAHAGTDCTDPVASTSDTCSRRRPDATATATTQTVAAPTAAAGPTPARNIQISFFCFFLLIST